MPRTISKLREQESLLAAKFLNANYRSLGQPDIPLRYIDAERYTLQNLVEVRAAAGGYMHMPPPNSLIKEIAALLWSAVHPMDPDEIWFPMGVGNHFDHRLTRDACLHMVATHWEALGSKQLLLYEDLPYAWEDPQSARKLIDLLSRYGAKIERVPVEITSVFEEKMNCLKIYASQWKVSALRPKIEACARRVIADRRGYGESLWKLREPPRLPLPPLVTVRGMAQDRLETAVGLLYKRRLRIRRLSILITHAVGQWADHAALLLRLFPSAAINVLAFHQHKAQFESFTHPRLHLSFFPAQPSCMLFPMIKWSCHLNHTALIFGGPRRIGWPNGSAESCPSGMRMHSKRLKISAPSCVTRSTQTGEVSVPRGQAVMAVHEGARSVVWAPTQDTIRLLVARGFFMVSGYFVSVILARGLGPLEYGVYGVIVSVLLWIEMVGSAGVPAATAQLLPQHQSQMPEVEQAARLLLLSSSLLIFAIAWWVAPTLAELFDMPTGTALFRLAILDIPLSSIYCAYQGILSGHRRFGSQGVAFIIYGLTKLAGILALLALGITVSAALVVNALATGSVLAYLVVRFPPRGPLPSYALLRSMCHLAMPMGLYLICLQLLLSLDLWSLKAFSTGSGEAIGIYVAALNVAKVLGVVPPVLTGILFASLAWVLARADEGAAQQLLQASSRFALIILSPVCTFLALHSQAVLMSLYAGVYATGGAYLGLQLIAFGLLAFLDMFFNAITVAGKPYYSAGILLALIPIALLLNMLLIPKFGALGAATALTITTSLATVLAAVLAYQRFGRLFRLKTIIHVATATAVMIFISPLLPVIGPWLLLKFFVLLTIYVLVLSLFREVSLKKLLLFVRWRKEIIYNNI